MSKQLGQTSEIARARKAKGWSQDALAHRAGCDQKTVSHIETGKIAQGPTHSSDVLTAHIEVCEKHPARKIRKERDSLRAQLVAKDAEIERLAGSQRQSSDEELIQSLSKKLSEAVARANHVPGLSAALDEARSRLAECEPVVEAVRHAQEVNANGSYSDEEAWFHLIEKITLPEKRTP